MMSARRRTISFEPVGALARWSRPQRFDFLNRLPAAPIADTELLNLSHYCPVIIVSTEEGPQVQILLDPAMVATSAVDGGGRWRPPYSPIALRSLPFWPGATADEIRVAPELAAARADESFALHDPTGDPSEQFALVVAWIERLRQGMRRLSEAAKLLVAADLLTPIAVNQPGALPPVQTAYFTVSFERLRALSPIRAASLTSGRCLPLDLVAACLFSRRLLASGVIVQKAEPPEASFPDEDGSVLDLVKLPEIDFRLDASPLFSFPHFAGLVSPATGAEPNAGP